MAKAKGTGSWRPPIPKRKDPVPETKYSFEIPPDPIPASLIKETITEEIVVGAGVSGLSAAISAVESGAKVILIDKTNTCHGYGGIIVFGAAGCRKSWASRLTRTRS